MRDAIETSYVVPRRGLGARVRACSVRGGSKTIPYDHGLSAEENHTAVARELAERNGWAGTWVGGERPSVNGYAFVCTNPGPWFRVEVTCG